MSTMFTTRPELNGTFGMVASTHWLASAAGMRLLEAGGNAFDAAAAAGFALQVVEPHLNGPGRRPADRLLARARRVARPLRAGPAPPRRRPSASASSASTSSPAPACSPPACPALRRLAALLRDSGRCALADVLEPAIGYARDGYPGHAARRRERSRRSSRCSARTGRRRPRRPARAPAAGSLLRIRARRRPTRAILEDAKRPRRSRRADPGGARRVYRGFVAEAIDAFCERRCPTARAARTRPAHRRRPRRDSRRPSRRRSSLGYAGWTIFKTGPWGQGPVLLQQLALLEGFDLASMGPAAPSSCTRWSSAQSSRSPTARRGTATRVRRRPA